MAESVNPIARLDSHAVESVSLQRFWYAGAAEETDDGALIIHSGGPTGSVSRGNDCQLASADAAAVIAILANAVLRPPDSERLPVDTRIAIRSADGLEVVASLPPRVRPERDGTFAVVIAVTGSEGQFYRLGGEDLARIGQIADATACA